MPLPLFLSTTTTDLSPGAWFLAILAAVCIGLSKTGFGGLSLVSIALMAGIMPARQSTGVVLPLLICADFFAVGSFRQHANWHQVWRLLFPSFVGVIIGALLMHAFADAVLYPDYVFRRIVGSIILSLTILQTARRWRPQWFAWVQVTAMSFAVMMGLTIGVTTMLANAAGPVGSIYMLAIGLPKFEIVGTGAWIFLILNLTKIPFNFGLGLINSDSLSLNLWLFPAVASGALLGRWLLQLISQQVFDWMLLIFATASALKLLVG